MKASERKLREEEFQEFLVEMDDVLEGLIEKAAGHGLRLDYSPASLDALEELWLSSKKAGDAERLSTRCARYVGEVYRRNLGGIWRLELDDPRKAAFGLPVISGFSTRGYSSCPTLLFQSFRAREKRGILRAAFDADSVFVDKKRH
jgi:hypothetical protein